MTTKHTPGPWYSQPTAGHEAHGQSAIASEATGKTVAIAYDGKADARLLAAAPDMLKSLQFISRRLQQGGAAAKSDCLGQCSWAIAEATSEPVMAA